MRLVSYVNPKINNHTDMQCPKCKKDFTATPYCVEKECLMRDVTGYQVDPGGGFLTSVDGHKYPLRALPMAETLNTVAIMKRTLIATAEIGLMFKPSIFMLLFTNKKRLLGEILMWMHKLYSSDYNGALKPATEHYCQSSREIFRVLMKVNPMPVKQGYNQQHGWAHLLCVIYETDMAYRFRVQDVVQEFSELAFKQNPKKEILRIIDLSISREVNEGQANKTKIMRKFVTYAWYFKAFRELLIAFFSELNIDEMKMNINDIYWVSERYDYNYLGQTFEQRQAWRNKEHEGWVQPKVPEILNPDDTKPRLVINKPNDAFYRLPADKAIEMAEQLKQELIKHHFKNAKA